jgi:predicted phosphodiesterase
MRGLLLLAGLAWRQQGTAMHIHLLSDIHLEIDVHGYVYRPSVLDADVTILAGDIHKGERAVNWARSTFPGRVLLVAGNHEYWRGHLQHTQRKMRLAADDRVRFLERDEVVIDGVRFLGATGWTDYTATGDLFEGRYEATRSMNDFMRIRAGNWRRIRLLDIETTNKITKSWLQHKLAEPFSGKTVVITHHAPSMRSVRPGGECAPGYVNHLDAAYANAWEDLMGPAVDLWVHGHTHDPADYGIRGTRVVSNPVGYGRERTGYDPWQTITL